MIKRFLQLCIATLVGVSIGAFFISYTALFQMALTGRFPRWMPEDHISYILGLGAAASGAVVVFIIERVVHYRRHNYIIGDEE